VLAFCQLAAGEELLIDYATTEIDPRWRMTCGCGTAGCRGLIRAAYQERAAVRAQIATATPRFLRRHWGSLRRIRV
jgi:hypothetical protein